MQNVCESWIDNKNKNNNKNIGGICRSICYCHLLYAIQISILHIQTLSLLPLSWKMTDTVLHHLLLILTREWRNYLLFVGTMPPVTNSYIIVVLYVCLIYVCQ